MQKLVHSSSFLIVDENLALPRVNTKLPAAVRGTLGVGRVATLQRIIECEVYPRAGFREFSRAYSYAIPCLGRALLVGVWRVKKRTKWQRCNLGTRVVRAGAYARGR